MHPNLYLETWCVYGREALVTFVCLLASMCHLVFLQLMYICASVVTLVNFIRLLASVRY